MKCDDKPTMAFHPHTRRRRSVDRKSVWLLLLLTFLAAVFHPSCGVRSVAAFLSSNNRVEAEFKYGCQLFQLESSLPGRIIYLQRRNDHHTCLIAAQVTTTRNTVDMALGSEPTQRKNQVRKIIDSSKSARSSQTNNNTRRNRKQKHKPSHNQTKAEKYYFQPPTVAGALSEAAPAAADSDARRRLMQTIKGQDAPTIPSKRFGFLRSVFQRNSRRTSHGQDNISADIDADATTVLMQAPAVASSSASSSIATDSTATESVPQPEITSIRNLWRRRHARSAEDGIRREKANSTHVRLSSLLSQAQLEQSAPEGKRRPIERTLMGLINALGEEVEGIDVKLQTAPESPIWRKEIETLQIDFNRLAFKPLRMGGIHKEKNPKTANGLRLSSKQEDLSLIESADEAFDRMDADNSGTLDAEELASAIDILSSLKTSKSSTLDIARELVDIYDANGDGVVDREEYQQMIEDMAALQEEKSSTSEDREEGTPAGAFFNNVREGVLNFANMTGSRTDPPPLDPECGSITFTDLKIDLRRLVTGGIPLIKHITPGGPLILEPFSVTVSGSFNSDDVLDSFLLGFGLRSLVARALRVRLRSYRDIVDGALLFGRKWNMASKSAPVVNVLELSSVEFDEGNKMVITGKAKIRASPDAPIVTNTFKVRTKIGTGRNGQTIRLVEPELAFVLECPETLEKGIGALCQKMSIPAPTRPAPIYSFFPIYSPFKVDDNAGYDMGDDNNMELIFIQDGALRFQMRSVLRPGRFLGNHFLAFTLPQRTFIITMDRVKEGIRTARRNKKIADREKEIAEMNRIMDSESTIASLPPSKFQSLSATFSFASIKSRLGATAKLWQRFSSLKPKQQPRSFFSRFVEGYTLTEERDESEQLSDMISTFFAKQQGGGGTSEASDESRKIE